MRNLKIKKYEMLLQRLVVIRFARSDLITTSNYPTSMKQFVKYQSVEFIQLSNPWSSSNGIYNQRKESTDFIQQLDYF